MGYLRNVENFRSEKTSSYTLKSDALTLEKPKYYIFNRAGEDIIAWPFYFFCNQCKSPWSFTIPINGTTGEKIPGNDVHCPRCQSELAEFCDVIKDNQ